MRHEAYLYLVYATHPPSNTTHNSTQRPDTPWLIAIHTAGTLMMTVLTMRYVYTPNLDFRILQSQTQIWSLILRMIWKGTAKVFVPLSNY